MRRTHRTALAAALLAAVPAAAQAPPQTPEARWVAEAGRLQDVDADATLRLARQALPRLRGPAGAPLRMRALELRCWAAAEAAPDSLLAWAEAGLADAGRQGDARAVAALRTCRGHGREVAGELDGAMQDYDFGVAQGRRLGEREVAADALVLRGELRYYRGDLTGALRDLDGAYRLYTALGDRRQQSYTLNAIANLYADDQVAQYDRAIEYYRQVLEANRATGSERGVATAYFNLGSTLERKGSLEEALEHYRRGLAMDLQRGDPLEAAVDRRAIGALLGKLGRPAEALAVLDQSLAYFRRAGDVERTAQVRLSRGVVLRTMGRTGEALADLEAARARFQATGNQRFLVKVHEERALAFAAAGGWRDAYGARSEQLVLQRALSDQTREEQTSRLRVQFDAEKKEQENRALLRENELRGQSLAAGARIRRLQVAVLILSAAVIAALALLVARQVKSARRLRITALTDELTRLPNRRHLLMLADEHFRAARSRGVGFGVLALDVDHFKRINDTYGHEAGDAVLRRVAEAMRSSLREGDHVGRTGGEEFVALLPGAAPAAAAEVAERLRLAVERTDFGDLHPGLEVTVSVGATVR
ncbi:MAG TPA: GGDEF domain-containing protein, partial [Longimicrobiaceae bacterium]